MSRSRGLCHRDYASEHRESLALVHREASSRYPSRALSSPQHSHSENCRGSLHRIEILALSRLSSAARSLQTSALPPQLPSPPSPHRPTSNMLRNSFYPAQPTAALRGRSQPPAECG